MADKYPFVNFQSDSHIINGDKDVLIFKKDNTCIIDSIFATSQTNEEIKLFLYIIEETAAAVPNKIPFITSKQLSAFEDRELLLSSTLYFNAQKEMYVYTDALDHMATLTISYRELLTIVPEPVNY